MFSAYGRAVLAAVGLYQPFHLFPRDAEVAGNHNRLSGKRVRHGGLGFHREPDSGHLKPIDVCKMPGITEIFEHAVRYHLTDILNLKQLFLVAVAMASIFPKCRAISLAVVSPT